MCWQSAGLVWAADFHSPISGSDIAFGVRDGEIWFKPAGGYSEPAVENIIASVILLLAPNFCHLLPTGRVTFIGSHAAVCEHEKPPLLLNKPTLPAPQHVCQTVKTARMESLQGRMVHWLVCLDYTNWKYGNRLQADFTPVTYGNYMQIFLLLVHYPVANPNPMTNFFDIHRLP